MPRIDIDFNRNARVGLARGALLLMAGVLVFGASLVSLNAVEKERGTVSAALGRQGEGAGRRVPTPRAESEITPERQRDITQANAIARRLNLPWSGLLEALERSGSEGVVLLSMVPDPQEGTLRLSGEGRSLPAVLDYLGSLQQQPVLSQVRLESHETMTQDPLRPVRFGAAAAWKPLP
jgi:hypothetical protein